MPMPTRWLEITLRDAKRLRFQFPVQLNEQNMARGLEEALKLPTLTIKAGDILYVIPTSAIQLITVSPAPKKLPRSVIRGAKLISE